MLTILIKYFIFCLLSAVLLALLEIQIEGKHGWAEKLPTWRLNLKFFDKIPGLGGAFTGYHVYLFISVLLLMHTPFLFMRWDIHTEAILISAYVILTRWEDFLWFVLNPHYGIRKFNKKNIPWHEDWLGPVPLQYVYSFVIWILLFLFGFRFIL